jgi:hypothetical protein
MAIQAKKEGKEWKEARMAVIRNTEDMGWFQAPRNVAFTMIGWLYGEGDFGKSVCATLGSIFGIIGGTKAIAEKWQKPIGNKIATVAISGFKAPATLDELTDSTVEMTKKVISRFNLPVIIGPEKSRLPDQEQWLKPDKNELEKLWNLSPWRVVRHNRDWVIIFDYLQEPYIQEDIARKLSISVSNVTGNKELYKLNITGLPEKWEVSGLPADTFGVEKNAKKTLDMSILANSILSDTIRLSLLLTRGVDSDRIPFTFFKKKP